MAVRTSIRSTLRILERFAATPPLAAVIGIYLMPLRASPLSRIVSLVAAVSAATIAVATTPSTAPPPADDAAVARMAGH
ncbi:MAG: hypothetical protein JF591_12645, partial [Lysobacter sp.]|nr:hypothetical protein [Lysobacter sp.]